MSATATDTLTCPIDSLLLKTADAIYQPVAGLSLTAWCTPEPVTFAQRTQGVKKSVRIGEPWGEKLFDCAWFRFTAELPADLSHDLPAALDGDSADGTSATNLVARIDIGGELLLVDKNGSPVRGLTNVKSTFDPTLGGPGKTVYELPAECISNGRVELWGDAGLNDLFGFIAGGGRVELAQIARVRQSVRGLYYDLETLRDYLHTLPQGVLRETLETDLHALAATLDLDCDQSVAKAREQIAVWFRNEGSGTDRLAGEVLGTGSALRVHGIGHAHIDLAWLWPVRETIRKGARTFASALYNIERYPEYVFGASQPQLFAWMKEFYPALYGRIKQAVHAGRIELQGTFWVEPDCNIPAGESFVRQVLHGSRFLREEFGIRPDFCWEPDVFGYSGQLPQILAKSGHRYFMTQKLSWNVVNRFPHHSFVWEGVDGTPILTHMLPEETYNGPAAARSLSKIGSEYAQKSVSCHALMAFGIGDGGGGPDAEHLERLRRAPLLPGLPSVVIEPAQQFFRDWEKDAESFPHWRGELYLERHQGTLTTQALTKRNNRRAEIALRELEWTALLADHLTGHPFPAQELDTIWKEILLYQFHDILPGSSIKRVYDECNARYAILLERIAELTAERLNALATKLGNGIATTAAGRTEAESTAGPTAAAAQTIAFNSLSWPRSQWLRDSGGNWQHITIPAHGWATLATLPQAVSLVEAPVTLQATTTLLENEHLRVRFAKDGTIESLVMKPDAPNHLNSQNDQDAPDAPNTAEREILSRGGRGNRFVIIEDSGDAWDYAADRASKDVLCYLRLPVQHPVLEHSHARIDGPLAELTQVWRYGRSQIRQQIRLYSGSRQLEFDTEADWHEEAAMLRVRFDTGMVAEQACYEIPFGHIYRSTGENNSVELAQFEAAGQQWVDLSQADFGLALYNDCKYGFRIKGSVIDMALLRSVPHPGAPLIGKDDTSGAPLNNFTDLGKHHFRYALRPHSGTGSCTGHHGTGSSKKCSAQPATPAMLTAEARIFNTPLQLATVSAAASPASGHWLRTGSGAAEIAAVKPAEDGKGWILRIVNLLNAPLTTTVESALGSARWSLCDLSENPLPEGQPQQGATAQLSFRPLEIKTVRCQLS